MKEDHPSGLLTPREAARRLRCHVRTVRRAVARGELAAVRIGRTIRVEVPDAAPKSDPTSTK